MDTLKLGQIITEPQQRDAIHIAVVPAVAGHALRPAEHVEIIDGAACSCLGAGVGVVDPFLQRAVRANETFWLWLKPGSITSLRHEWTHPAFPAPVVAPQADRTLREDGAGAPPNPRSGAPVSVLRRLRFG